MALRASTSPRGLEFWSKSLDYGRAPALTFAMVMSSRDRSSDCLGLYEELNVFGTPTRAVVIADESDELPPRPRGFTWRPLAERSAAELHAYAGDYRRMAETASTLNVMAACFRIAIRLEALAERREREQTEG